MTFWQSIKTGFQNGNIAKWTKAVGTTSFAVGFTGAVIHDMNKGGGCCGPSIWNFSGNSCFGGCGPDMFNNPLGVMPFGGFYGNSGCYNMGSQQGINMAYQAGYADMSRMMAQYAARQSNTAGSSSSSSSGLSSGSKTVNEKMDNEFAGKIDADQDTTLGKAFDDATNSGKEYKITDNLNNDRAKYKEALSNLGKSYGALLDEDKDGSVSLSEYIAKETKGLSGAQKTEMTQAATTAFNKLDLNKDGKLDWKELSSAIATFDVNSKNQQDGKLDKVDCERWSINLIDSESNIFDKAAQQNYKQLFIDNE